MIEETNATGGMQRDYIFFDGRRIAWWSSTGNSIQNSGFESGNTDWNLGAGWSIVDDPSNAQSGNYYLSGGSTSDTAAVATGANGSKWVPVKPGQVVTFGGWIKRTGGTGILDWSCEIVDASYNWVAWCGGGAASWDGSGGTSWQFYSASVTAPANSAYVQFYAEIHCCNDSDNSNTTGYFDNGFLGIGGVYYQFSDAIGSTRAVTDSSGNVCFSADYYPYGQENDYVTSCSPTYKFAGYEYDSETGNYYAYARYYNPRLGRFMSPDPLAGSVDDPQSLNRYTYVLNNPESLVDPWGLQCTDNHGNPIPGCQCPYCIITTWKPPSGGPGSTYCIINTDPQGPGNYQAEPEDVCRLSGGEGGINDNMMGGTLQYGTESEFSNYLGQRMLAVWSGLWRLREAAGKLLSCTFTGKVGAKWGKTALDAAGLIPGESDIVEGIRLGASIINAGVSAVENVANAGMSFAGAGLEFARESGNIIEVQGEGMVPILGTILSVNAVVQDAGGGWSAYGNCMSGGG